MAKKKKSKQTSEGFSYSVEFVGLILILIGICGLGRLGFVGLFIEEFAMFLGGEYWFIILLSLIYLGGYALFKRKLPNFFTQRLIGIYLILLIILTLAHLEFLNKTQDFEELINITYENYMERIGTITNDGSILSSGDNTIVIGGGVIGAIAIGATAACFGKTGTIIFLIIVGIFAAILAFNITFADLFKKLTSGLKKEKKEPKTTAHKEYILEGDELVGIKGETPINNTVNYEPTTTSIPKEKDNKIVITSIDELKSINTEPVIKQDSFDDEVKEEDVDTTNYRLPKFDLLTPTPKNKTNSEEAFIRSNQETLERVLNDFEIKAQVVEIHIGPAVTEYEITVPNGTKVNRITNINKEIALAMAAKDVRIQAPIPGKNTIGIEIPNREIASVGIREVLESTMNTKSDNKILVALGKDIMGKAILADLAKMPHLLVAGSTGSGKSVCINSIIASILMRYKPNEVKLMLVDPKKVELSNYNGTPHLLCPVVTDPKKANAKLQKIVAEMENRYELFAEKEFKNIAGYNEWVERENKKHLDNKMPKMPYIVVIIDELADLMLVASKEVQDSIMRITQMARAAGIHLIVATQRPSTDIITGVIKNNIPSRIAFAVSSSIDSRTILDAAGAEKLLGRGDMLYAPMGQSVPTRIQGCFISDGEISKLIEYCKTQATAKYNEEFTNEDIHTSSSGSSNSDGGDDDPMYDEIVEFAIQTGKISASLIQRRFRFGYNRAARMVDLLEARGIIGPQNGSKPREVLIKMQDDTQE
ncbi:MAG: DNA translocase FtsK [Firmicutes bacterium]|nr:DNA translocase FtsK [Bacillota bacterium]